MISRRQAVLVLGAGALGAPLSSLAQQPSRTWRVGFLYFGTRKAALDTGRLDAFVQEMRKLGYVQGDNLTLEERFVDNNTGRIPAVVADIVRLRPDVIVATGGPTYRPLRNATTTIPIVITVTVDPISAGYAATLARPGGNLTGLTDTATDLGPKHLELLVALVPRLARVAVLMNPDNPTHASQVVRVMSAAQKIDKQLVLVEARTPKEIEAGFATMMRMRADALIVFGDTLFVDHIREIAAHALMSRLPSASLNSDFARDGFLLSYGPNLLNHFRRAAVYVDKILKGANPGDLPFEQPTQYQLLINLKTAKTLGITVPQSVLVRADELIK